MVLGVFAPWSSGGDPAAWYPEEAWNQADPGGAYHCVKSPSARPVLIHPPSHGDQYKSA
jgi:hypothetical protein